MKFFVIDFVVVAVVVVVVVVVDVAVVVIAVVVVVVAMILLATPPTGPRRGLTPDEFPDGFAKCSEGYSGSSPHPHRIPCTDLLPSQVIASHSESDHVIYQ